MTKVLIVEDDFMVADCLEEILSDAGFEVCAIAGSLAVAIELGRRHRPALAVLDMRLSDGHFGAEVAEHLRLTAPIGVLYTTGNPDDPRIRLGPGDRCLSKPYTAAKVVAALRAVETDMAKRGHPGVPEPSPVA